MDVWQRRAVLNPIANPEKSTDYVATLTGILPPSGTVGPVSVVLRYVPDALIVTPEGFGAYLKALEEEDWTSHEALATTILGDVSNELVARWSQVVASHEGGEGPGTAPGHQVMIEDRQPKWDNPSLLALLPPV